MNAWQLLRQVKYLIENLTWDDGSGEKLVRIADITPLDVDGILAVRFLPSALVVLTDSNVPSHRQEEEFQNFEITLAFDGPGDQTATAALMGKDRGDGADGRGILEAEPILKAALAHLTEENGVSFSFLGAGSGNVVHLDDTNIVSRTYRYKARCTQQRTYEEPTLLRKTGVNPGSVLLQWALPGDRFDRKKIVLRRDSTAPQTITDGTGVTLGSDLAVLVIDPLTTGTYWYSVFCLYDDNGTEVEADYNASPPFSWKVVFA